MRVSGAEYIASTAGYVKKKLAGMREEKGVVFVYSPFLF